MADTGLVCMGRSSGAFGLKGELRVFPYTEDPETLLSAQTLMIGADPQTARSYAVRGARINGARYLFSLEGIESREQADLLKGSWVYLPAGQLPELEADEYYWHQAVNARVMLENGEELGRIKQVSNAGAHDLWLIEGPQGQEALIPAIDDVVLEVELEKGRVVIRPLEGLLEAQGFWPDPDEEESQA